MVTVITGSRGFIGGNLVRVLSQDDDEVIGVGRTPGPVQGPFGSRYQLSRLDNPESLLPSDYHGEPFHLVHLAWDTARPPEFGNHAEHVARLAGLLDYWTGRGLQSVVVAGTAEEYGQSGGVLTENDPALGAVSAYGWGKSAARLLLQSWALRTNRTAVWVRPFVVYGPNQGGRMAVAYAVRQAMAGLPADFSDGLQLRDFIDVDDVAHAFRAAVRLQPPGFSTINIGTGEGVPVRSVLELVGELMGTGSRFRFGAIPRRPGEPATQIASTVQAAKLLGWRAKVHWTDGIRNMVASVRRAASWTA